MTGWQKDQIRKHADKLLSLTKLPIAQEWVAASDMNSLQAALWEISQEQQKQDAELREIEKQKDQEANRVKVIFDFEKSLQPGQRVEVRWTNAGRMLRGKGEIVRINKASVRVKLEAPVGAGLHGYPAGHEIVVPLLGFHSGANRWSENNRVAPVQEEANAETEG